jgi:hypothetical protein
LQGLVTCDHCGRRLLTHYRGRNSRPGYHCAGKDIVDGRGQYCLNVGGLAIDRAVANAFLEAVTPGAVEAVRLSVEQLQSDHDAGLSQWRLAVERARYEAQRAERRYRAVEPENRLVARGLETEWERVACGIWPPRKRSCADASNSDRLPWRRATSAASESQLRHRSSVECHHHDRPRSPTPSRFA